MTNREREEVKRIFEKSLSGPITRWEFQVLNTYVIAIPQCPLQ